MWFRKMPTRLTIEFTNTIDREILPPEPAAKVLPDWYKKHKSYIDGIKAPPIFTQAKTAATIKRCVPVFDSLTAGYIISTPAEIHVARDNGAPIYSYAGFELLGIQTNQQAENYPYSDGFDVPKLINYWSIRTPKGYSCLFLPPMHRETPIRILPGVVDTDVYTTPVNFPFQLTDPNFTGFIPIGTPIVQVIPFKRDIWQHEFEKDMTRIKRNTDNLLNHFFDGYRNVFWNRKEYK